MIVNHCIVDLMSVMFLMPIQEYDGTVMMMKSLKLVIFQKMYILEIVTKKLQRIRSCLAQTKYYWFLYQNKLPYIIKIFC